MIRRQVGGTTALWGGRCVKFDPIDFEHRPLTAQAPWPIRYEDVEPYLQRACDWAACGQAAFNARDIPELAHRDMVAGLPDGDVRTTDLERWSLPTRFGREYRTALRERPAPDPVDGPHVHRDRDDAERVTPSTTSWSRRSMAGRAASSRRTTSSRPAGLEATRLLLASDRHHPAGLGNAGGHLGRWYMSHVEGRVARVQFTTDHVIYAYERDNDGVYIRRRFTLDPRAQRERGCPMPLSGWSIRRSATRRHGNGILSGVYLTLYLPGRPLPARGGHP